jgi:hypothetical protein
MQRDDEVQVRHHLKQHDDEVQVRHHLKQHGDEVQMLHHHASAEKVCPDPSSAAATYHGPSVLESSRQR